MKLKLILFISLLFTFSYAVDWQEVENNFDRKYDNCNKLSNERDRNKCKDKVAGKLVRNALNDLPETHQICLDRNKIKKDPSVIKDCYKIIRDYILEYPTNSFEFMYGMNMAYELCEINDPIGCVGVANGLELRNPTNRPEIVVLLHYYKRACDLGAELSCGFYNRTKEKAIARGFWEE